MHFMSTKIPNCEYLRSYYVQPCCISTYLVLNPECPTCDKMCKPNKLYNLTDLPLIDPKETSQRLSNTSSPRKNITATAKNENQYTINHSLDTLNQKSDKNEQPKSHVQSGNNVSIFMVQSLIVETLRSELTSLNISIVQR